MRRTVTISVSLAILFAALAPVAGRDTDAAGPDKPPSAKKAADAAVKSQASAKPENGGKAPRNKSKKVPGFTGEREAAAMTFVRNNHPELAELLDQLKKSDPAQYQRAIRDLFKSSERLAQAEERNPQRYPLELSLWKVTSRIQVLLARLTMSPDPAIEDQLRQALAEQIDLRKQLLAADQERLEQRLAELKSNLADLEEHRHERIEQQMTKLLDDASRSRPSFRQGGHKKTAEQQ